MAITNTLTPAPFNFSRNFIPVKFQSDNYLDGSGSQKANYFIYLEIWLEDEENAYTEKIYEQNLPLEYGTGGASTDLKDILNSALENAGPDYMTSGYFFLAKKSLRRFYIKYAENDNGEIGELTESEAYIVTYGGLSYSGAFSSDLLSAIRPDISDATKDRFLRQGNASVYTRSNQPQYLYFLNTRDKVDNPQLFAKFYFTNTQTLESVISTNEEMWRGCKYGFSVRFDELINEATLDGRICQCYEVYLRNESGEQISEIRTFYLDYTLKEYVRYFIYWSCWGALNTLLTYGQGSNEIQLNQSEARRVRRAGDDIKRGDRFNYDLSINNGFKCATGFTSRREIGLNRDFYLSPFKFRYSGGKMLPISVTSKSIAELEDGNGLYAQKFEYSYLFDDDCYTEGDIEDGIGLDAFFFDVNPSLPFSAFSESDPTVPYWVKAITLADIVSWNTGGSLAGTFYSIEQTQNFFNGTDLITGYNKSNWDTAYSWGDHSTAGYATPAYVTANFQPLENQRLSTTDSVVFSKIKATDTLFVPTTPPSSLVSGEAAIWIGSLSGITDVPGSDYVLPIASASILGGIKIGSGLTIAGDGTLSVSALGGVTSFNSRTGAISLLSADVTGALGYTPVSNAGYNSSNWDTAYSWGNHASAGYEFAFSKNTAFNKNFGNATGTVADGGLLDSLSSEVGDLQLYVSERALLDGSNATGTWGINISGIANSAIYWGGTPANFGEYATSINWLVGGEGGIAKPVLAPAVGAFLGLGSNAYTSTAYHPLENQRLSTDNGPTFAGLSISNLNSAYRAISFNTGNSLRWYMGVTNEIETGSNTGSDFSIFRYGDSGDYQGMPFTIRRSSGDAIFTGSVTSAEFIGPLSGNSATSTVANSLYNDNTTPGNEITVFESTLYSAGGPVNISGNANSANIWGGRSADFSAPWEDTPQYLVGSASGIAHEYSAQYVKSFLGLGSNAYTSTAYLPLSGGILNGNLAIGTNPPINAGGAAKWLTLDGTGSYSGGVINSVNGVAKMYTYYEDGYAILQGASSVGIKLQPNGVDALTISADGSVNLSNTIYTGNWYRSLGVTGWYNETYGGGINMEDSDWVRVYNSKKFRAENDIYSATKVYAPTIQATALLKIPTVAPASGALASGEAAMWIGSLSGVTT